MNSSWEWIHQSHIFPDDPPWVDKRVHLWWSHTDPCILQWFLIPISCLQRLICSSCRNKLNWGIQTGKKEVCCYISMNILNTIDWVFLDRTLIMQYYTSIWKFLILQSVFDPQEKPFLDYTNSNKLIAITIMPAINPPMAKWCSPYSSAVGSSSSNEIYTIIPATEAKIMPKVVSLKKDLNRK